MKGGVGAQFIAPAWGGDAALRAQFIAPNKRQVKEEETPFCRRGGVDEAWGGDACVALVLVPRVCPLQPGRRKRPHPTSTPLPPLRNTHPSSFFAAFFLNLTPIGDRKGSPLLYNGSVWQARV